MTIEIFTSFTKNVKWKKKKKKKKKKKRLRLFNKKRLCMYAGLGL